MSIRYQSVSIVDMRTGYHSAHFVPRVHWVCGHSGLVQDWTNPGECPRCGAALNYVDLKEPGHDRS